MIYRLNKYYNNKYQNVIFTKNEISEIFKLKFNLIKKFYQKKIDLNFNEKNFNYIFTLFFLKKNLIKKLNRKEISIIYAFYKKFSVHLCLKKKYHYNLKKKTNSNTEIEAYIFLCFLIRKLTKLNLLQKLNIVLKINDLTIINLNKIHNKKVLNVFAHNLLYEINIIKKIIK